MYFPNNNTLPLSGLCIDNTCLGQDMVVTGVRPYYTYENGVRTDKLEGFRYSVILLEKGYYALNVKIPGEQKIELVPGQSIPVKFTGLKLKLYYDRAKRVQIAASAEDISPLE